MKKLCDSKGNMSKSELSTVKSNAEWSFFCFSVFGVWWSSVWICLSLSPFVLVWRGLGVILAAFLMSFRAVWTPWRRSGKASNYEKHKNLESMLEGFWTMLTSFLETFWCPGGLLGPLGPFLGASWGRSRFLVVFWGLLGPLLGRFFERVSEFPLIRIKLLC